MIKSKKEAKKIAKVQLKCLVQVAGSQAHLARMLSTQKEYSVSPQAVKLWLERGQISKRGAVAVMHHAYFKSEFTYHELRPDVTCDEWNILLKDLRLKKIKFTVE